MPASSQSSNESLDRTTPSEKAMSSQTSIAAAQADYFHELMEDIIDRLRDDVLGSITMDDVRRLRENVDANDERGAEIISKIEAFAKEHERLYPKNSVPRVRQAAHTSLPTVLEDLSVAVDKNPTDVTPDVLKAAQAVVSSKYIWLQVLSTFTALKLNSLQRCKKPSAPPTPLTPS